MDDVSRNRIESFDNRKQWIVDHKTGVDTNTKLQDLRTVIFDKLAALHTEVGAHAGAASEGHEQTEVKADSREDGVQIAVSVREAALAAASEQPGIDARYPYPRFLNLEDLVALLRSYAIGGATDAAIITAYGAPADWVTQCTGRADDIEAASNAQASATEQRIGSRASYLAKIDELSQLFRTADRIIQNVFKDDVAALASWKSAMHVKSPPKKKKPTP